MTVRRAVVTGAARGIGAAIANRLSDDGAEVIAIVRNRATIEQLRAGIELVECDLAQPGRAQLLDELGPIDVLVNNAAIYPRSSLADLSVEELRTVLEVNAVAPIELMQAASRGMRVKGWGRIINVTSITEKGGWTDLTAYVASKGALSAATRLAARELGKYMITVNSLAPGAIPTAAEPEDSEDSAVYARQSLPVRGSVDDIAAAAAFLVSDEARFITGQTIVVDGGWTMS